MIFPVEIRIVDSDELAEQMATVRCWLDHQRVEPVIFRYSFAAAAIRFRVDFATRAEAAAFAAAFDGRILAE